MLPWIPLMHGGGEGSTIEDWKHVAGMEPDSRLRSVYGSLALVFAELAERKNAWKQALEGWNMRESTVIGEWIAEGRAEGLRTAIRRVVQKRLCDPVPDDLAVAVRAVSDPDELDRLLDVAATADSLDAFRAALHR